MSTCSCSPEVLSGHPTHNKRPVWAQPSPGHARHWQTVEKQLYKKEKAAKGHVNNIGAIRREVPHASTIQCNTRLGLDPFHQSLLLLQWMGGAHHVSRRLLQEGSPPSPTQDTPLAVFRFSPATSNLSFPTGSLLYISKHIIMLQRFSHLNNSSGMPLLIPNEHQLLSYFSAPL